VGGGLAGGELGAGGFVGAGFVAGAAKGGALAPGGRAGGELVAGGFTLVGLGGALGMGPGAVEMLGTAGAGGTVGGLAGGATRVPPNGEVGAFG
jgi:hypothetical protein